MDSLIGETVKNVRVCRHPGGVDYDIRRVGDTATWYLPAASLEAV